MAIKVTVDGLDLDSTVTTDSQENPVSLAELVAQELAASLAHRTEAHDLRVIVGRVQAKEIREQVARRVAAAMDDPPGGQPVTLTAAIVAEVHAQQSPGYQGTATPLNQVVAAEVYNVLHSEVLQIVTEVREQIRDQVAAEIGKIVERSMGRG